MLTAWDSSISCVGLDVAGKGREGGEYLHNTIGIGFQLNAIFLFDGQRQLKCIDRVQADAIAKKRCFRFNFFRGQYLRDSRC